MCEDVRGEHDDNKEPLAECNNNNNDDDQYGEDGNIPNDNNEYTIGIDGADKSLHDGNN